MKSLRAIMCAAVLTACSTPSVPIPPPDVDVQALSFTAPASGEIVLSGKPTPEHANALFFIINFKTGDGVITSAGPDGSFTSSPIPAVAGDTVEVQFEQQAEGVVSNSTCITVLLNAPLSGETCP